MQNEQLIFKNMLKYETAQLKTKLTASFAKSTVIIKKWVLFCYFNCRNQIIGNFITTFDLLV